MGVSNVPVAQPRNYESLTHNNTNTGTGHHLVKNGYSSNCTQFETRSCGNHQVSNNTNHNFHNKAGGYHYSLKNALTNIIASLMVDQSTMTQEHKTKVINKAKSALAKIEQRIAAAKSQESYGPNDAQGPAGSEERADQLHYLFYKNENIEIDGLDIFDLLAEGGSGICAEASEILFNFDPDQAASRYWATRESHRPGVNQCIEDLQSRTTAGKWTIVDLLFLVHNFDISEGSEIIMPS